MSSLKKPPLPKANIIGIMPEFYSLSFTPLKRQIDKNNRHKYKMKDRASTSSKKEFSTLRETKKKEKTKWKIKFQSKLFSFIFVYNV